MLYMAGLVDSATSTRKALKRLAAFSDEDFVVIRLLEDMQYFWFVRRKADLLAAAQGVERRFGRGDETPIGRVLELKTTRASRVYDVSECDKEALLTATGVALDGRQVLGVLQADVAVSPPPQAPAPPASQGNEVSDADDDSRYNVDDSAPAAIPLPTNNDRPELGPGEQGAGVTVSSPGGWGSLIGRLGSKAIGVLMGSGSRGGHAGASSSGSGLGGLFGKVMGGSRRPSTRRPGAPAPSAQDGDVSAEQSGDEGARGGAPVDERDEAIEPDETGAAPAGRVRDDVVYPKLEGPERVEPETPFELVVSLTQQKPQINFNAPLNFQSVVEDTEFELEVQVLAPGFTVEGEAWRTFPVSRLDYERSTATFTLTAGSTVPVPSIQRLDVTFLYQHQPVGTAFLEVAVGAPSNEPLLSGSNGISTEPQGRSPDLTVLVKESNQDGHLAWTLSSPHPIDESLKEQVDVPLGDHNGQSFAIELLKGIPRREHRRSLIQTMRGVGQRISSVMPATFWKALEAVRRQMPGDDVPRVLIISTDPYVPWELATTDAPYFDQALVDKTRPNVLCAQMIVGRWLDAPSRQTLAPYPQLPPPINVGREKMAVVVGDYLAKNGVRPLPEAEAEGAHLLSSYPGSIRLTAEEDPLYDLLDNDLEVDGARVDVSLIHFACHGLFDATRPEQNGIVLNDNKRFDPTWAHGNTIGAMTQPFAFMNACEVGVAGESLGGYGGFAGAFIKQGFSGFLAPLWAVHDTDAREFATAFYEKTMGSAEGESQTIGEALRDLRAEFLKDPEKPASTYVSYILYAHPDLRIARSSP